MKQKTVEQVSITPPRITSVKMKIVGTAPYVQNKFSHKAKMEILDKQVAGSTAKTSKKREPKVVERLYKEAMHLDAKGNPGIPVTAIKSALVRAASLCQMEMKRAKICLFVQGTTIDADEGTELVPIIGTSEIATHHVRIAMGTTTVAVRPMWRKWKAEFSLVYDQDVFNGNHIINLVHRAGLQVGIGEGRPDSKVSHCGMGWGTFRIATPKEEKEWLKSK